MKTVTRIAASLAIAFAVSTGTAAMAAPVKTPVKNIVLVHGFFADGPGWQGVADILTRDGTAATPPSSPVRPTSPK